MKEGSKRGFEKGAGNQRVGIGENRGITIPVVYTLLHLGHLFER